MTPKRIVYLLGAGATHAEVTNLANDPDEKFLNENGLLISNVSKRVMLHAQSIPGFKKDVEWVTSPEGSLNIELLISLFSSNRVPHSDLKVNHLKRLVQEDITKRLSQTRKGKFYLHKGLLELHSRITDREHLIGIISLNYDDVLDEAYEANYITPDYCHTSNRISGENVLPLLKLHGSFNWTRVRTYGRRKAISIVPLGINKNYLVPPYNFIWSQAFDILARCDILRVIGCSLNQNDIGLIDLLFKAHLERTDYFEIQIVDMQAQGDRIKNDYGFFPGIVKPKDLEDSLIADDQILKSTGNPFKIWLRAKSLRMLDDEANQTKYLRKCL